MIAAEHLPTRRASAKAWAGLLMLGALFLGRQIVTGGSLLRTTVAVVVIMVLAVPAMERPRGAMIGLFIALPFLGLVRHLFMSTTGVAVLDPLLLIPSAVAFTVFVSLTMSHRMDFSGTPLAMVVFLYLLVGMLQVFNPDQGNLLVGLSGVMINLVPITFFFIARSIADLEFTHKIVRVVLVVGVVAGLYGLVQVFVGFRGFEKSWFSSQGYTAGTVGSTLRPFSFFNNVAEFAAYVQIAFIIALAMLIFARTANRMALAAATAIVAYAGFLTGQRGFTYKIAIAAIVLLAARVRNRMLAAGVVVVLVSAALWWSATTTSTGRIEDKSSGAGQLVEQQMRALRDPLDPSKSTLAIHFRGAKDGILFAVTRFPAGLGTGASTRGGAKFGGAVQAGTEMDVSDAFLSLGIVGGILYALAVGLGLLQVTRVRRALPGPVWIAIWAIAISSLGAWTVGGQYAIPPLIWFLIGAADGACKRLRDRGLMDGTLPV